MVVGGGDLVGCETALLLAQQGKKVSVVEMMPEILGGHGTIPHMNEFMLVDILKSHKVNICTNTRVTMTNENSVNIKQGDQNIEIPADTLIISVGYNSNNVLYEEIKDLDIPAYNVGDSNKVHDIMYAIWDAYELGRNI